MKETARIRPIYGDTDAMGVVYYGNYFRWFEVARTELLRQACLPYKELTERGYHLPVIEANCRYVRSARYDVEFILYCALEEIKGARLRLAYRIEDADGLICTGFTAHAFVDNNGRPVKPPKDVVDCFRRLIEP